LSADDRGSVAVLLAAIAAIAFITALLLADVALVLRARAVGSAAADAAALAAAPVTFRQFGAAGSPRREAAAFARANGATLVRCGCAIDRSFRPRDVVVEVAVEVETLLLGARSVVTAGRAHFDPTKLGIVRPPVARSAFLR